MRGPGRPRGRTGEDGEGGHGQTGASMSDCDGGDQARRTSSFLPESKEMTSWSGGDDSSLVDDGWMTAGFLAFRFFSF